MVVQYYTQIMHIATSRQVSYIVRCDIAGHSNGDTRLITREANVCCVVLSITFGVYI